MSLLEMQNSGGRMARAIVRLSQLFKSDLIHILFMTLNGKMKHICRYYMWVKLVWIHCVLKQAEVEMVTIITGHFYSSCPPPPPATFRCLVWKWLISYYTLYRCLYDSFFKKRKCAYSFSSFCCTCYHVPLDWSTLIAIWQLTWILTCWVWSEFVASWEANPLNPRMPRWETEHTHAHIASPICVASSRLPPQWK